MYFLKCLSNFNHPCHQYLMLNSLLAHCCVEAKLRRIHRFSIQEEGKTCRTVRLDNRPLLWDRGFCHLHNSTRQLYVFFFFMQIRHPVCSLFVQFLVLVCSLFVQFLCRCDSLPSQTKII